MAKQLSRANIAYDLTISPHHLRVFYEDQNLLHFVFSSELYKNNFEARMNENREKIQKSLSNRFGYEFKCNILCDLVLYSKIEKRGFLVFYNGAPIECPDNITLDGNNLIMKI